MRRLTPEPKTTIGNGRRKADRDDDETCTDTCNTNAVLRDALFPLGRPFAHVVCANKNDPVANGQRIYYYARYNKHHVYGNMCACIYNKYTPRTGIYGRPAGGEREPRPRARSFKVKLTN